MYVLFEARISFHQVMTYANQINSTHKLLNTGDNIDAQI